MMHISPFPSKLLPNLVADLRNSRNCIVPRPFALHTLQFQTGLSWVGVAAR